MSVFYIFKINIFSKTDISLTSHFFNITRLDLACLNRDIYIYLKVFFVYIFSLYLVILFNIFI